MHNYPYHKMTQEKQSQNVNFGMLVCNFNVDKSFGILFVFPARCVMLHVLEPASCFNALNVNVNILTFFENCTHVHEIIR